MGLIFWFCWICWADGWLSRCWLVFLLLLGCFPGTHICWWIYANYEMVIRLLDPDCCCGTAGTCWKLLGFGYVAEVLIYIPLLQSRGCCFLLVLVEFLGSSLNLLGWTGLRDFGIWITGLWDFLLQSRGYWFLFSCWDFHSLAPWPLSIAGLLNLWGLLVLWILDCWMFIHPLRAVISWTPGLLNVDSWA